MEELVSSLRDEAMESHLRITAYERQALLTEYRKGVNPRMRLRAHILLLLAEGYWWAVIAGVLQNSAPGLRLRMGRMLSHQLLSTFRRVWSY